MISCEFENGDAASLRHVTVDCLVLKDGQILLGKRAVKLQEGGKWCLLGGFMDRDETLAQAASREIMEESGWEIANIQLFRIKDYPERPHEDHRQNVSFVFITDAVAEIGQPDWETVELRWFNLDNLPDALEIAFDHADDIELYKSFLVQPFTLPIIGHQTVST